MPDLVHSSRPRPDLVQTNPDHDLVHSSRSSMRTNGRDGSNRQPNTATSSSSTEGHGPDSRPRSASGRCADDAGDPRGVCSRSAPSDSHAHFMGTVYTPTAEHRADVALTCSGSGCSDLRRRDALRSHTQEVRR